MPQMAHLAANTIHGISRYLKNMGNGELMGRYTNRE